VEGSDLFVKLLREDVDLTLLVLIVGLVSPQLNLSKDLVGERAGHNETGVTSGATQVKEAALGEEDNSVTVGELVAINLVLDIQALDAGVAIESLKVNFVVEVTDVSNNSVVLHLGHMLGHDDVFVTGGSDKDVSSVDNRLDSLDFVAFHTRLEGADGVTLGDDDTGATSLHGSSATLTDITEPADNNLLASKHDIGGTHETIGKRVFAAVNVVELLLGDRVVDVDGSEEELALLGHLLKSVHASGGLLGETNELLAHLGPEVGDTLLELPFDKSEDDLEFLVGGGHRVGESAELLEGSLSLDTFVHHDGSITTVIDEHVGAGVVGPDKHSQGAFPVFLEGLSLPGEDVGGLGGDNSSSGVILGGVDIARAPSDYGTEFGEGLDEGSSLDGHVEGSRNAGTLEDLARSVLFTDVHETGHFDFGDVQFFAAEFGELNVSDFVIVHINHG
jgi:hypothetical protein